MKVNNMILTAVLLTISLISAQNKTKDTFKYEIDLTYYADDLFHVTCYPPELSEADSIYNFVAFAPGVHQTLNFGRFVKFVKAYDEDGEEVTVEIKSVNEWRISKDDDLFIHSLCFFEYLEYFVFI